MASAAVDFVDRGDREDRLARVERLVGQRLLGAVQIRQIVGGEDRLDARHRQRARSCRCCARARAASG